MLQLETIDPRILGQRIAEARKARGVTQEDVANYLNCSRPTYIAIEKGERPAKAEEIVKLASYFGRKVSELVRPGEPVVDFQPHLRAAAEKMKAGRPARTDRRDRRSSASRGGLPRVGANDGCPAALQLPAAGEP